MPKTLVFMRKGMLKPAGGPAAVCYYYNQELERRKGSSFEFLDFPEANTSLHDKEEKMASKIPKWLIDFYYYIKDIYKINKLLGGRYPIIPFDDYNNYEIVHFHDTRTMYERRYELANYKGIVVLQSHSPQPLGHELYNVIPSSVRFFVPFIKKRFEKMDRYAFERADYIVFPCEEAEEPYYHNWPYYKHIHNSKQGHYRYVLTGIPECTPRRQKSSVLEELKLSEKNFLISYVGRHNEVKGFDLLKRIGEKFLSQDNDARIVCAGKEEPLKGLNNNHWIEIGWTNDAHSYISASDVFILPNRETYFDIVMIEVLSLGKIVIASRTGGNKYFEKAACKGVFLYDTVDEAVDIIKNIKQMTTEDREALGAANKEFYKKHLSVSSMYDQYVATLEDIYNSGK